MVNVSRENRRYGRVIIERGLRVSMRSIGSEASYNMETRNVSDTGFFLRFEKPGRFPFTPSSIMEVWLTLEEGSTIFFNGKMTRVVHPEEAVLLDTEPGIAIKIIQIEKEEENILREFIRKKATENEENDTGVAPAAVQKEDQEVAAVLEADTFSSGQEEEAATPPKRKATRRKTPTTKKKTTTRRKKASSKKTSSKKAADVEEKVAEQVLPPPVQVAASPTELPPPKQTIMSAEVVLPPPVQEIKPPARVPPPPEQVVPTEDHILAEQSTFPDKEEKAG